MNQKNKRLASSKCSIRQALNCELGKELPSNTSRLIAIAHDHFINQHVVALFDVVNTNL
jgi:hypothetical protein